MLINTNKFIRANFFMRGEEVYSDLPVLNPSQVHGKEILTLDDDNYIFTERPKADGILLKTRKIAASLRFADCAPVLLYHANNADWVMILHSGFKGTALNISSEGVKLLDDVKNIHAWIGPCIGFNNYMRDFNDEWTQKALKVFDANNYRISGDKVYFNLAGEIYSQLKNSGLASENILCSNIDTFTNPECYSYRRGDITQRMTLLVQLLNKN